MDFAARHACDRLLLRHGIEATAADWAGVVLQITGRTGLLLNRDARTGAERWLVLIRGIAIQVVWSTLTGSIITVMPPGGGGPKHVKKINSRRQPCRGRVNMSDDYRRKRGEHLEDGD